MSRTAYPPEGSSIHVSDDASVLALSWPPRKASPARFGMAAFMMVWLCGWAFGEVTVARMVLHGGATEAPPFMLIWLCAWTLGGLWAMATIWSMLRGGTESVLRLSPESLVYREGRSPIDVSFFSMRRTMDPMKVLAAMRRKPANVEIARTSVRNLKLERIDGSLRLTVDKGADRIAIGAALGEPELEWLHGILRDWTPERGGAREPELD